MKAFESGDVSFLESKRHRSMYLLLFEAMIKSDKPIDFFTIQNLPYPGTVVESAMKLAQIISERKTFPNIINQKIEHDIDKLHHIFQTNADILDYADFITYNLINNVRKVYIRPRRNRIDELKRNPKYRYKCLVKNCDRILPSYNALFSHLSALKDKEHTKAWKANSAKFDPHPRLGKGLTFMEGLFELMDKEDAPTDLPIQYFKHGNPVEAHSRNTTSD